MGCGGGLFTPFINCEFIRVIRDMQIHVNNLDKDMIDIIINNMLAVIMCV